MLKCRDARMLCPRTRPVHGGARHVPVLQSGNLLTGWVERGVPNTQAPVTLVTGGRDPKLLFQQGRKSLTSYKSSLRKQHGLSPKAEHAHSASSSQHLHLAVCVRA